MINVLKANKEKEIFNEEKLRDSIKRAGIPSEIQVDTLAHIKSKVYDGITTAEIRQHISEFLDQSPSPYSKARYGLKESIMALGPTGYPFEDFIARLLAALGYQTKVRQLLQGKCITHEIDVIADKEGKSTMVEAKFHNNPGTRSEVHVALYTHARFEDIKIKNNIHDALLVTNTKTTVDANTYAQCAEMKVMSWSYPKGGSLRELIEKLRLYPITMLTSLGQMNKMTLLNNHIVLCKEIYENPTALDSLPMSKEE